VVFISSLYSVLNAAFDYREWAMLAANTHKKALLSALVNGGSSMSIWILFRKFAAD